MSNGPPCLRKSATNWHVKKYSISVIYWYSGVKSRRQQNCRTISWCRRHAVKEVNLLLKARQNRATRRPSVRLWRRRDATPPDGLCEIAWPRKTPSVENLIGGHPAIHGTVRAKSQIANVQNLVLPSAARCLHYHHITAKFANQRSRDR